MGWGSLWVDVSFGFLKVRRKVAGEFLPLSSKKVNSVLIYFRFNDYSQRKNEKLKREREEKGERKKEKILKCLEQVRIF